MDCAAAEGRSPPGLTRQVQVEVELKVKQDLKLGSILKDQAMLTIDQLIATLPQTGLVRWLGIRPARHEPMQVLTEILVTPGWAS